ncbi:MAG TPA: phage head-tail connector protein [Sphingobium sp.]|nr:phage head-tail connector protein [Sphingobium sp.]
MLSAPIVITPPEGDVVDLEAVKTFLRVDSSALDDEIAGYIRAAVTEIERITSTRLAEQVVEIRADRFADLDHLTIGPVTGIVSIIYQSTSGTSETLVEESYELFGAGLETGIRPAFGHAWPAARGAAGVIAVQLEVGYSAETQPASIDLALKQLVRSKFDGTPFDLCTVLVNDRIWM